MRTVGLFALLIALFVSPALAQEDLPDCETPLSELDSVTRQHARHRNDRIEDLGDIMDGLGDGDVSTDRIIEELIYWTVMAESADFHAEETNYPDCSEYKVMDQTYQGIINDTYAIGAQTVLLLEYNLNEYQSTNLADILRDRIQSMNIGIGIWIVLYEEMDV